MFLSLYRYKGYGLFWDNYSPTLFDDKQMEHRSNQMWAIVLIIILCTAVMRMESLPKCASYRASAYVPVMDVWLFAKQRTV